MIMATQTQPELNGRPTIQQPGFPPQRGENRLKMTRKH